MVHVCVHVCLLVTASASVGRHQRRRTSVAVDSTRWSVCLGRPRPNVSSSQIGSGPVGRSSGAPCAKVPNEDALDDDLMAIFLTHVHTVSLFASWHALFDHCRLSVSFSGCPLEFPLRLTRIPHTHSQLLWYHFSRSLYAGTTAQTHLHCVLLFSSFIVVVVEECPLLPIARLSPVHSLAHSLLLLLNWFRRALIVSHCSLLLHCTLLPLT